MPRKRNLYDVPPRVPQQSVLDDAAPSRLDAKIKVPPKRKVNSELADLRSRARRAGASAKATVSLQIRASLDLYKALVALAEEYHQPVATIARQCLEDGTRKYRDFSVPGLNPFGKVPITRAHPTFLPPSSAGTSLAGRLARPARDFVGDDDGDIAVAEVEKYAEALAKLPPGLALPSTPPLAETHRAAVEDTGIFEELDETSDD